MTRRLRKAILAKALLRLRRDVLQRTPSTPLAFLLLLLMVAGGGLASAATVQVQVLLDTDDNPSTGCTVTTSKGTFTGADQVLTTRSTRPPIR